MVGLKNNPGKTTTKPQVTDNFLSCLESYSNPGSGERQCTVIGNIVVMFEVLRLKQIKQVIACIGNSSYFFFVGGGGGVRGER